jgi:hypothetical protein
VKKIDLKKLLLYLVIAFVIVSIWKDPSGSAKTAGTYLGNVGNFLVALIDKGSSFIKGLTGGGSTPAPTPTSTTIAR